MIKGSLTTVDGAECYRIDGVERMDPFLMSVVSASDLWMFASSHGTLTAGRFDADHALFPYDTDDRLHRAIGTSGPFTLVARSVEGVRELWQPFGPGRTEGTTRSLAKATLGDRLILEETNTRWGVSVRVTWMPAPSHGWVRRVDLTDIGGGGASLEVLDGLLDVMPSGVIAGAELQLSNLVDAYKRSETGRWGTAAVFSLEALVSDQAEPAEALSATVVWSHGDLDGDLHLDERVVSAMREDTPFRTGNLVTGRRGAYLLRGHLDLSPGGTSTWTLVADTGLNHAEVVDRTWAAHQSGTPDAVEADVEAGSLRLRELMEGADGFQRTGDPLADAHHLSNVMFNAMRGGLFPHGPEVPVESFIDHVRTWNRVAHERHAAHVRSLGDSVDIDRLLDFASTSGDPDLVRLVLEYLPIAFSRRHGDPSRPWNRFSIRVQGADGEELLGYEGNWRDIFQNWEASLFSQPGFVGHAIAKFVNASTIDGHNPYRITDRGIDWETLDPHDPWSNIGYWGDHQIVYLHRLLDLWERLDPGGVDRWLDQPVFVYADVPYVIADRPHMVRDPRNTIAFDHDRAGAIDERVERLGTDGKLLTTSGGSLLRVGLLEKLIVPALAKVTSLVPGGGIWMNTQRPEWNDANNALAGYGVSMVTLFHLYAYIRYLETLIKNCLPDQSVRLSGSVARWMMELTDALERWAAGNCHEDERARRALMDELGAAGDRHRHATRRAEDLATVDVATADLERLCRAVADHLQCAIDGSRREDGLYDSYNLVSFPSDERARVESLGAMLEGQVAVLSSGALDANEMLAVVESLYESPMYRPDQNSFLLYPDRDLHAFVDRNKVSAGDLSAAAVDQLTGPGRPIVADRAGDLHFAPEMVNAAALDGALARLSVDAAVRDEVLAIYERTFNHHAYTGRSGSMHAYEGLGSIYWHMVGKLLLAVQEAYWAAVDREDPAEIGDGLAQAYRRIRSGLGFQKSAEEFGAIPTDCYSHTPSHAGAQQPGMTGQVKEQILTRFGELGLRVDAGQISLTPGILPRSELLAADGTATFQYCGVQIRIVEGDTDAVQVRGEGGWSTPSPGLEVPAEVSQSILRHEGTVEAVTFTIGPESLR